MGMHSEEKDSVVEIIRILIKLLINKVNICIKIRLYSRNDDQVE